MAYLKNQSVNLLAVNYGLYMLAANSAWVFFSVFVLKRGLPVPAVFGALGLLVAGRFVTRPLVVLLAPRYGVKKLLAFGTAFSGVQYLFVPYIHGVDAMLFGFCATAAIGDAFYWTTYHAYFARIGDAEHRGHQISAREAFASLAGIIGPLIGGWTLTVAGPNVAFPVAAVIHLFAALPLLGTPEVHVAREVDGGFRAAWQGVLLFAADGWIAVGAYFAWQIALFLSLGESFSAYGAVLAAAALAGAAGGLVLGRHIDSGHGGKAVWVTFAALAGVILFRASVTHNAGLAVLASASGALAGCLYVPTLMTAVYNQAKQSPCALRFHAAAEGGWDIGCAAGCAATGIMTAAGAPLSATILLALAGAALSLFLLRRYYGARPRLQPA
jgi:hypothetical protein